MLFLITLVSIASIILILSITLFVESLASTNSTNFNYSLPINNKWEKTSVAVIIPAHNEEKVIGETLNAIIPQLKLIDQLIVIADNCSDRTAEIAREIGVIVEQREDQNNRGKGYVLDYGLQCLTNNPPDIVIFIDADSIVHPQAIPILTEKAVVSNQPLQALYLMETPPQPTPKDQISAFAFKVKNLVRPLGLSNLQQPCLLTGTGMAFPWKVINSTNLASGNIVEDMKLGIDLAIAGYAPQFCPTAQITGRLPQKQETATTQRTRWEHGHLQSLLTYVPLLLKESIKQKKFNLFILALDLAIPPVSLFVFIWLVFAIVSLLTMIVTSIKIPFILSIISGLMIMIAISTAWMKFGKEELSLLTLINVPLYILWKIPLYFKFLLKKESQWIRTERDH